MQEAMESIEPIVWREDKLCLLDQRKLPHQQLWLSYDEVEQVAEAIREMVVRGAPAIGVTAAYGVVLAARQAWSDAGERWKESIPASLSLLQAARPTAVNLFWAIDLMSALIKELEHDQDPEPLLLAHARFIHEQDVEANKQLGQHGASLLPAHSRVLTHCNAGALATAGFGTALGVIRAGYEQNKVEHVYVDETRPWLQGSRLTAWELMQEGIPMTLQSDVVAASVMAAKQIDWVIVGADRIAANGDVVNKIGTYSLAVLAKYHGVKMMVAAPTSTIDWQLPTGAEIPIEQRSGKEVTHIQDHAIAPIDVVVSNPAFDMTPADLIDAIVTEKGIIEQPTVEKMLKFKNAL